MVDVQERALDSIQVGHRHRSDLGDLGPLMESIRRHGLLQPLTVTPEGVLVCGRRRMEALRLLGIKSVRVWVRSGVSDQLSLALAEQDENTLRKPFTQLEEAALYREIKSLLAEDASRRQEGSRFGGEPRSTRSDGGGESPPPREDATRTRSQAARMVTGKDASQRLERIGHLQGVVADEAQPLPIRRLADAKLSEIEAGAPVDPAYQTVVNEIRAADASRDAWARAKAERPRRVEPVKARPAEPDRPRMRSPKALELTVRDLAGWTRFWDVQAVAASWPDDVVALFDEYVAETVDFRERLRAARAARSPVPIVKGA